MHIKDLQNPKTIGQHIKKRRLQLKLLQSDISKIFNVTEESITNWENGHHKPAVVHYPGIIGFLGYDPFEVDTSTLGGRIKRYRYSNGVSQEKLAEMVGVDESTILDWERNRHKPFPKKRVLLERIVNPSESSL